jgi:hypothetical protein
MKRYLTDAKLFAQFYSVPLQLNSYTEERYGFQGSMQASAYAGNTKTCSMSSLTRVQELASDMWCNALASFIIWLVWVFLRAGPIPALLQQSWRGGESHG